MAPGILLTTPALEAVARRMANTAPIARLWEWRDDPARREAEIGAVAIVVTAGSHAPGDLLADMPELRLIASVGAGYEEIDLGWAELRGIGVTNTPGVNSEDVADHAVALMLALTQRISAGDRLVRAGGWAMEGPPRPGLRQLAVGIVGLGSIGRAVAARLAPFGVTIAWWGPNPDPAAAHRRADTLSRLAAGSDVLIVAARAETGKPPIIDASVIAAMKPGCMIVNVARGLLIDEDGLIAALRDGRLGGAALDVFETEPTPGERWRDVPNVVLSPHLAGVTGTALDAVFERAARDVDSFVAGRALPDAILQPRRPWPAVGG